MNAVSFEDDCPPPTERVPASGIARLVARMRPDGPDAEDDTLTRMPSLDLLAQASGEGFDLIAVMREHYARGEVEEALAIAGATADGVASLVVDDADLDEIDSALFDD